MRPTRFVTAFGVAFVLATATAAYADDELGIGVPQADVPIAVGEYADVPVTIVNHTAATLSGLALQLHPSYRYEQRSEPDCGPLVPEFMAPQILRSALAPIPAGGERTCVIRVHRDAGMAESPLVTWWVLGASSIAAVSLRFGLFADIDLTATLLSRSVSADGIHSIVRLTAHNPSDLELVAEIAMDASPPSACEVAQAQQVVAGACVLTGRVCDFSDDNFLRWPSLASGATAQCDLESTIPLAVDTESPTIYLYRVNDSTSGEYVHPSLGIAPRVAFPVTHAQVTLNQSGVGGTWANAATPAQGFVLDVSPDLRGDGRAFLFGGWFTYGATAGSDQRWYTLQGDVGGTEGEVGLYYSTGGAFGAMRPATTTRVGSASVRFADCNHGQITYRFDPGFEDDLFLATIPLTRLLPNATCTLDGASGASPEPGSALAGTWADRSSSAQGLVIDVDPAQRTLFAGWFTYPASGTDPQRWYTLQGTLDPSAPSGTGIGLYESTGGMFDGPAPASTVPVGDADITLLTCSSATLVYRFTSGANAGRSGTLDLSRLGAPPASCAL